MIESKTKKWYPVLADAETYAKLKAESEATGIKIVRLLHKYVLGQDKAPAAAKVEEEIKLDDDEVEIIPRREPNTTGTGVML